jgi:hypothetical protein
MKYRKNKKAPGYDNKCRTYKVCTDCITLQILISAKYVYAGGMDISLKSRELLL